MTKTHVFHAPDGSETTIEPIPTDVDPVEYLRQQIHDCPDCQAAIARGEQPTMLSSADMMRLRRRTTREAFPRPPRWRTRKHRR